MTCIRVYECSQIDNSFGFELDKLLNKHDLRLISVPGRGDCQLHSVMISYINNYLLQDANYHASLSKIKRSIENMRKT